MKVAAYQTPLEATASLDVLRLIRDRVAWCESDGVQILCCPEAVLGGLADYASGPTDVAIQVEGGRLDAVLAPLASDTVTTILGFSEIDRCGRLYNAAAVYSHGVVHGVYRKLHPAIRQSVYDAGDSMPVFSVGGLTFGIVICRDSNYAVPAAMMAAQGATALFVPTNNGLPPGKSSPEIVADARKADTARAVENRMWVIRADVAGRTERLIAYGASAIVDAQGQTRQAARPLTSELIVTDIDTTPRTAHVVRVAEPSDGDAIAVAHRDSIRSLGRGFYPPDVVDDWQEGLTGDLYWTAMAHGEVFFIATGPVDGKNAVLGFASDYSTDGVTHGTSVYVRSLAARRGLGSALLRVAEAHAVDHGAARVHIEASLAGVEFYKTNGYAEVGRGETRLMCGRPIGCVFMQKDL